MVNNKKLLSILQTVSIPIAIYVIFEIIDRSVSGLGVINTMADVNTLLRNLITAYAFAIALDTNLSCGRMDLSLGAQMYVGVIFGGLAALSLGLGGIGVLVMAMVFGGICGIVIGLLFVHMRILPMILGLAMTLIFECLCYEVNDQQGVTLFGRPGVSILSNMWFIILVAAVLVLVTTYLFQFSKFGYRRRAIQGNQKLAADAGINIYKNCIGCYIIAGALAACAGVFDAAFKGRLSPVMGMTSNNTVFSNMFPMVLGAYIGSFCRNQSLGVLMGALSVRIMIIGLSRLGLGSSTQNLIVYSLFLIFVVINTNKDKISYYRAKKARIAQAHQIKLQHQRSF